MTKIAIITGITGQDGAYLAKLLIDKGYIVHGTYRRNSSVNFWRITELNVINSQYFNLHEIDLTDLSSLINLIEKVKPDEIYNLAAQSFVGSSFQQPILTSQVTGMGVLNVLESIRLVNKKIKFYQASTSEMFGLVQEIPQRETTNFYPRSPYGVSKLFGHWMVINYRESYDIFAASGILFNHESPLRGIEFVTRKITRAIANIINCKQDFLELGNLDAKRDWGFAGDYVEGMWKMLQAEKPDSFILATNTTTTVKDFVKLAFKSAGINLSFRGSGINEVGVNEKNNRILVKVNPLYYRPSEVEQLLGDYSKAKKILGWEPKVKINQLIDMMVQADLKRLSS